LSVLNDGMIKNVSGVLAIAVANTDYLTPSLASGKLWIGNDANLATPQETVALSNLPNLGVSAIEGLPLPAGKIWRGTAANRPEESDAFSIAEADILALNARFLLGEFIMGDALVQHTYPKAQFLINLEDGLLKKTGKILQRAVANTDYLTPSLASGKLWIGSDANLATQKPTIAVANLPNLNQGKVWQGGANNRPVEVTIAAAPVDARYILQQPNQNLTNAQSLNQLVGIQPKILKAGDDGAIAVAIPDQDYATKEKLEQIKAETEGFKTQAEGFKTQAEGFKTQAEVAAEEAAASAEGATGAAAEATSAATEATGAATTAAGSAAAAGASAIAAGLSAGSASSSASNASSSADRAATSATNAQSSATGAADSLNTLLHTDITLQGAVYGSGGLLSPIPTNFSNNPVLPGSEAMTIPKGTTTQRPATPIAGMVRYNNGAA